MILSRYIFIAIALAFPTGALAQVDVIPLPLIPSTSTAEDADSNSSAQQTDSNQVAQQADNNDRMQSLAAQMAQRIMRGGSTSNPNTQNAEAVQNTNASSLPVTTQSIPTSANSTEISSGARESSTSELSTSAPAAPAVAPSSSAARPQSQVQPVRRPRPNPAAQPAVAEPVSEPVSEPVVQSVAAKPAAQPVPVAQPRPAVATTPNAATSTTDEGTALVVPVVVRNTNTVAGGRPNMSPLVVVPSRQPVATTPVNNTPVNNIPVEGTVVEEESADITEEAIVTPASVSSRRSTVVVNAPRRSSTVIATPVLARPAPADLLQAPRIIKNIQTAGTVPQIIRPIAPAMQQEQGVPENVQVIQGIQALQGVQAPQSVQHGTMQAIASQGVAMQGVAEQGVAMQGVAEQGVAGQHALSISSTFSTPSGSMSMANAQAIPVMPVIAPSTAAQVHMVQVAQPTQEPIIQPSRNFIPVHDDGVNVVGSDSYTVQPGDYLMAISRKVYGNDAGWSRILTANPQLRRNPDLVVPGMVLTIPR